MSDETATVDAPVADTVVSASEPAAEAPAADPVVQDTVPEPAPVAELTLADLAAKIDGLKGDLATAFGYLETIMRRGCGGMR